MEHVYEIYLNLNGTSPNATQGDYSQMVGEQKISTENNTTTNQIWSFFKKTVVMGVGVQAVQWQISLIGRNQGSSLMQEKINAGMQIGAMAAGVGAAAITGGPVGAAAAVSAIGLKLIKDQEQYAYNARWENINLALSRERLGTSAAMNRSRNV